MAESILSCGACLRRAIQLLPQQRVALERAALLQPALLQRAHPRLSSTVTSTPSSNTSASEVSAAIAADVPRSLEPDPSEPTVSAKKAREKLERAVRKNLSYMDDPWKIGQYVQDALAKDRYDEALLVTQKASSKHSVVVSWNHLIGYMLEKQQLKKAIKLFNEMKKRAQLPNMQTYTVMFRGLAKSQHPKLAVPEAIKHYQALLRDGRLQPNSTHLNAVINVCGRAGDLESMFHMVETINDTTRAADAFTYTTIINALRFHVMNETKDLPLEQKNENISKAIGRAKALWSQAIPEWRQGRLFIDEEMVCAMGRLLIMAPDRVKKREVFDLLQQTMDIRNLTKPELDDVAAAETQTKTLARTTVSSLTPKTNWVRPGRNTLGLVLTALASSKQTTAGIKYWNLLVREYGIVPDMDNWMRLFGLLKVAKASAHASEIIDVVPDEYINYKNYRIAMETCVRDNINRNAIKNSNKVLDSMMKRLKTPDPHVLRLYLRVSLVSHYQLRIRSDNGDVDGAKGEYGMQIIEALNRLWDPYHKLYNHYFNVVKPKGEKAEGILYNDKREVIALARIMYSSYNKVIQQGMLSEPELTKIRHVGARINREIHTFFAEREELEPKLRRTKGRGTAEQDMSEYDDKLGGEFEWDTTQASRPKTERRERRDDGNRPRSRRDNQRGVDEDGTGSRRRYAQRDHHQPSELRGVRDPHQRRASLQW